jgi:hypothetical protein
MKFGKKSLAKFCLIILIFFASVFVINLSYIGFSTNETYNETCNQTIITIITVQSYPTVGGNWTVEFNTTGIADLAIRAVDGTEFGGDIEFLELRCGDKILTKELIDGAVFIENYSCDETGYEINKVLTSGKHTLEFDFSGTKAKAYNQAGNWWNSSWQYRKQLNITNNNNTLVLENGFSIPIVMNTTDTKFLSNGDDLRIVWLNGSNWIELDRINETTFNSTTTKILFKLQQNISASGSDSNYYAYYGNPGAINPPTNKSNVYDFWDGFSNNLTQWTVDSENLEGTVYVNTTQGNPAPSLRHNPDSTQTKGSYFDTRLITNAYRMKDGIIEYDVYLAGTARIIHQFGFRVFNINFTNGYCWRVQSSAADAGFLRFTGRASWVTFGNAFPAVNTSFWHHVILNITNNTYRGVVDGGSTVYTGTDNTKLTLDYLVSHVHGVTLTSASYALVDNIKVIKYFIPSPSVNIGSEEIVDNQAPTYSLNSTNSTLAGTSVIHSLYWQDNSQLSHAIFSFDNCTGTLQNITTMSLSGLNVWSNFTAVINSTVECTIRWCVYTNDTSNNWNGTSCENPFSYTTTSLAECSVAIGLSNALATGISFGSIDPGNAYDATGNNGVGTTDYYITVSISGCTPNTANVYTKASGDMSSGIYTIALANEKIRNSTSDNTVPANLQNISLTTNYADNKIGDQLSDGSRIYLKYNLNVPTSQRAASNYQNNIYFWGGRSDQTPP